MFEHLLILGASARAAAFSAHAAAIDPVCGDLFADVDLLSVASATAVTQYPAGLVAVAQAAPPGPWMYTGGLENHPALVSRISTGRELYGNDAAVLLRVRDPFAVRGTLTRANLPTPELASESAGLPRDGTWLRKAYASTSGLGVAAWRESSLPERISTGRSRSYFQRRIPGDSAAAIYLGASGRAQLLGATRQLLTSPTPGADAFRYAGSVGPLPLDVQLEKLLTRIGDALCAEFGLVGLFGVDLVLDGQQAWPVEVNPRYAASTEILERAFAFSAVAQHIAACRDGRLPSTAERRLPTWHGKQLLYAASDVVVSDALVKQILAANASAEWPVVADIPAPGSRIRRGQPVVTVFAQGANQEAVLSNLNDALHAWQRRLLA